MKCYNQIVVAYFNNGKSQIYGSYPLLKNELGRKINGRIVSETCSGIVECKISPHEYDDFGRGSDFEVEVEFRCNRCGILHELPYTIEDIQTIVTNTI